MGLMRIKAVLRWMFDKIADFIVSLMDWKARLWFRMGWSRPLNIGEKKK